MNAFFTYRLNRIAVRIALASFSMGTLLFLIQLANLNPSIDILGFSFILAAIFVNAIILIALVVHGLIHHKDFEEHISTITIVLLNIPITLLYIHLITT